MNAELFRGPCDGERTTVVDPPPLYLERQTVVFSSTGGSQRIRLYRYDLQQAGNILGVSENGYLRYVLFPEGSP